MNQCRRIFVQTITQTQSILKQYNYEKWNFACGRRLP